jgi:DNA-binding transcriptional MocR family regulator
MDDTADTAARNARHAERLRRKKEVVHEKIAAAGIHTGVAVADAVTEMNVVKHAFEDGIAAQPGVEW